MPAAEKRQQVPAPRESAWKQVNLSAPVMDEVQHFLTTEVARANGLRIPRDVCERALVEYMERRGWIMGRGLRPAGGDADAWRRPI